MKGAIIVALLLAMAVSQYCPMCAPGYCTYAAPGISSCSQCAAGALFNITIDAPSSENNTGISTPRAGMCQPCPVACTSCHFDLLSPAMSIPYWVNECDQCQTGYTFNWTSGGCVALPANCLNGSCEGDLCTGVYCSKCKEGYTTNTGNQCYYTGSVALEGQEESGSSVVGMAIWATVATLAVGVLISLYMRERRKNGQPLILNPTSEKRVSF